MQNSWIIAYITIVVMMTHGYAQNLLVNVVPTRSRFSGTQDVEVTLTYKNNGPNSVLIYKWYLPNRDLFDQLFDVTLNSRSVEYVGPLVKRRVATAEDMIRLDAGKDVSTVIDLPSVYNMTETGNYAVQFKADVGPMLLTSARQLGIGNTPSTEVGESILQSDPAVFSAVGRSNEIIDKSAQINTQVKASTYTYIGCSTSRQSSIVSAIRAAASYSSSALQYLTRFNSVTSKRYPTWFGKYSYNNLVTLRTHFTKINAVFNSKPMSFDCGCTMANTYAYVYATLPYKIYLCPVFWPSPMTGTDSKGGTLIHETSHFKIVAGTNDNAYGQAPCQALAKRSPTLALNNADSHQYFAENNPPQQ